MPDRRSARLAQLQQRRVLEHGRQSGRSANMPLIRPMSPVEDHPDAELVREIVDATVRLVEERYVYTSQAWAHRREVQAEILKCYVASRMDAPAGSA